MGRGTPEGTGVTFIDLEFDTGTQGAALLGDIATSLVNLDELLRDLASIASYPSSIEFRKVEIVAIEMRSPMKVRLSLSAISSDAVSIFEQICRDIIIDRKQRLANVDAVLQLCTPPGEHSHITDSEAQRLYAHVVALKNAAIPLRRIEVSRG